MIDLKHRPDIDGLRGLAVLMVVMFHASGRTGGYAGVDIFFVISGYLITGLVLKDLRHNTFRIATFWSRRMRRLLPAAAVTALAVLIAGYFFLLPSEYEELGRSVVSQQALMANVFFWRNTGYFDGPADLKPFLHTWSLAVEEQFYLAYPFLLIALHRLSRRTAAGILGLLAASSLVLSQYGVLYHPSAAFYLLPTRAWELLLGSLIWFAPVPSCMSSAMRSMSSWIALALIALTVFLFDSTTPFPGLCALVPSGAAATLIYANSMSPTVPALLLESRPLVFVGLISYSLYLSHWPLLAFARGMAGERLSLLTVCALLSLAFALSIVSWRLIETPFRRKNGPGARRQVVGLCCTVPIVIAAALFVLATNGFPSRVPHAIARYEQAGELYSFTEVSILDVTKDTLPRFGDPVGTTKCVVWGDSHAMALMPGIDAACKLHGIRGAQATHSSTAPLEGFVFRSAHGLHDYAVEFADVVIEYIRSHEIDMVVLAARWSSYAKQPEFEDRFTETLAKLAETGATVLVVLDVPNQQYAPGELVKHAWRGAKIDYCVDYEAHRAVQEGCNTIIGRCASETAIVLDPTPYFMNDYGQLCGEIDERVLYSDAHHLSIDGARLLSRLFDEAFARVQRPPRTAGV